MAIDDSDFLRPVARLISWVLVDFFYEIGFQVFSVWLGRMVLLVITLGKYPNSSQAERDELLIGIFGFIVLLVAAYIAFEIVG
ncbi:hypothetical protein [Alcanivorax sp. IL2]|uniref:hypothetical protein n=1 Tax=Alcanivorax sp. IL2 TaxID=3396310 RepID=UPI0039C3F596